MALCLWLLPWGQCVHTITKWLGEAPTMTMSPKLPSPGCWREPNHFWGSPCLLPTTNQCTPKFTPFWACPYHNSPPIEDRISKFRPKIHHSTVKILIDFDWHWPSIWFLISKPLPNWPFCMYLVRSSLALFSEPISGFQATPCMWSDLKVCQGEWSNSRNNHWNSPLP